jgi:hypothetical protein
LARIPAETRPQSATGEDSHSEYADPLFPSLTTPNLQVESTSPALNKGTNLGATIAGALDFAGNPRAPGSGIDMGAYQQWRGRKQAPESSGTGCK